MLALCMMYVYIYICLFAGDHALCMMDSHDYESGPLIIMSALDLVVWVCAQGNCCRRICHQVTSVSSCMQHASICLTLWRALARLSMSMLACVVYIGMKSYWCTIAHQTWNSVGFSPWKLGTSIAVFSQWMLGENSILCAMMHLRQSIAKFPPWK